MPPSPQSSGTLPLLRGSPERVARLFDEEIHPLVGQRFADMLQHALPQRDPQAIWEMGCAAGGLTRELTHRYPAARLVATEASPVLLDLARARVGTEGQAQPPVSFRSHDPNTEIPFAEESFDLLVSHLSLAELNRPEAALTDWARVLRPGGQLLLATPLAGTWTEVLDILCETLMEARRSDALEALKAYQQSFLDPEAVARLLENAGLTDVAIELRPWDLVFRSARELFYAPVIVNGPLVRWKQIVGTGPALHEVFTAAKAAIDIYFAGRAFSVSVVGGRFQARRPG